MATKIKPKPKKPKSGSVKRITSKKQQKASQDNRVLNIVLLVVGVIFVVGLLFSMLRTGALTNQGHGGQLQTQIDSGPFADLLRQSDIVRTSYSGTGGELMIYPGSSWQSGNKEGNLKRLDQIGKAWQKLVEEHAAGSDVNIMVHTPQDQMIGTWYPSEGPKLQQ